MALGVITEQWREGGYVIDFKVGQSFGEPQDEEVLVGGLGFGGVALQSVGASRLQA